MKKFGLLLFALASLNFCFSTTVRAETNYGEKVKAAMKLLQDKTAKLGVPSVAGTERLVGGKVVPVLSFGKTKMIENYTIVDELRREKACVATIFVKSGSDFVRIATNVLQDDGNRAITTLLAKNAAYEAISKGQAFYGPVDILGKPYETGYEPIKDAKGETIGIYFVGFQKI